MGRNPQHHAPTLTRTRNPGVTKPNACSAPAPAPAVTAAAPANLPSAPLSVTLLGASFGIADATASALLGTLQMLTGAAAMGIVGLFANGKPLPMVIGMATGALVGVALAWITLAGHSDQSVAAASA